VSFRSNLTKSGYKNKQKSHYVTIVRHVTSLYVLKCIHNERVARDSFKKVTKPFER